MTGVDHTKHNQRYKTLSINGKSIEEAIEVLAETKESLSDAPNHLEVGGYELELYWYVPKSAQELQLMADAALAEQYKRRGLFLNLFREFKEEFGLPPLNQPQLHSVQTEKKETN